MGGGVAGDGRDGRTTKMEVEEGDEGSSSLGLVFGTGRKSCLMEYDEHC